MIKWRTFFFFYVGVWLYLSLTSNKQSVPKIHEKKRFKEFHFLGYGVQRTPINIASLLFYHKEHRILCFLFYSFQIFSLSLSLSLDFVNFNHFFVPYTRESDLWYRHTDWKWNRRTKKIVIRLKRNW